MDNQSVASVVNDPVYHRITSRGEDQMPRAIALGGASAAPNSGQGCSGYLIEDGDLRLVLDLGPGTLTELLRHCEISSVSGIVITHFHVDHILDLVAFWWGWLHRPDPLPAPIPLWLPPDGTRSVRHFLSAFGRGDEVDRFFDEICSAAEYSVKQPIQIGGATISFAFDGALCSVLGGTSRSSG